MKVPEKIDWVGKWEGRVVACIASGPSLTQADCDLVRAAGLPTIVTNTTYQLCPWADVLFAFDSKWWKSHIAEVNKVFKGEKITRSVAGPSYGVRSLRLQGWAPTFMNSGADAIGLCVVAQAKRVILLGCDGGKLNGATHWHGDHGPKMSNAMSISEWPKRFRMAAKYAKEHNVEVVNCSRHTVLDCFPRVPLETALSEVSEAVAG